MGIFTTPVGGAAFLGFLFSLIGLWILVLLIMDGLDHLFKRIDYSTWDTEINTYLDEYEDYLKSGKIGWKPLRPINAGEYNWTPEQLERKSLLDIRSVLLD